MEQFFLNGPVRPAKLAIAATVAVAALMAIPVYSFAGANAVNTTVTATVSNAITLNKVTDFNAGKFALVVDNGAAGGAHVTDTGTVTYDASGGGTAYAFKITAPTLGAYGISGAAPNATIHITYTDGSSNPVAPGSSIDLTCSLCPVDANQGVLKYTYNDNTSSGTLTTDVSGKSTLNVGGDIVSDGVTTHFYHDGTYSGVININANY